MVRYLVSTLIVLPIASGIQMISSTFNCFSGTPSYADLGQMLEKECRLNCIWKNCLFYQYEDGTCYIDSSGSDIQEGSFVGRIFRPNMSDLSSNGMAFSSSAQSENSGPASAIDGDVDSFFHSKMAFRRQWWILDLFRSFEIHQINIVMRQIGIDRFKNVTIYLSHKIDFTNFFQNEKMTLFKYIPTGTDNLSSPVQLQPDGASSMCRRYLTITKDVAPNLQSDEVLEMNEVQIVLKNQEILGYK